MATVPPIPVEANANAHVHEASAGYGGAARRGWQGALAAMPETIAGVPPLPMSVACSVTLDDLLSDDP